MDSFGNGGVRVRLLLPSTKASETVVCAPVFECLCSFELVFSWERLRRTLNETLVNDSGSMSTRTTHSFGNGGGVDQKSNPPFPLLLNFR